MQRWKDYLHNSACDRSSAPNTSRIYSNLVSGVVGPDQTASISLRTYVQRRRRPTAFGGVHQCLRSVLGVGGGLSTDARISSA